MRPSPILCRRMKSRVAFTTKKVGNGFYRGNQTGSLGAHTQHGSYVIDWRKVRHYVVPDLTNLRLTPFVGRDVYPHDSLYFDEDNQPANPRKFDGHQYLKMWKNRTPEEYRWYLRNEDDEARQKQEAEAA